MYIFLHPTGNWMPCMVVWLSILRSVMTQLPLTSSTHSSPRCSRWPHVCRPALLPQQESCTSYHTSSHSWLLHLWLLTFSSDLFLYNAPLAGVQPHTPQTCGCQHSTLICLFTLLPRQASYTTLMVDNILLFFPLLPQQGSCTTTHSGNLIFELPDKIYTTGVEELLVQFDAQCRWTLSLTTLTIYSTLRESIQLCEKLPHNLKCIWYSCGSLHIDFCFFYFILFN